MSPISTRKIELNTPSVNLMSNTFLSFKGKDATASTKKRDPASSNKEPVQPNKLMKNLIRTKRHFMYNSRITTSKFVDQSGNVAVNSIITFTMYVSFVIMSCTYY